jgi:hypothetical protein
MCRRQALPALACVPRHCAYKGCDSGLPHSLDTASTPRPACLRNARWSAAHTRTRASHPSSTCRRFPVVSVRLRLRWAVPWALLPLLYLMCHLIEALASQVLVLGTSRHPQAAVLQAVVAISPSNSGRLRRSPPVVSTSSRFPRSPLPIPCLASTLGHLSHRRFEPLESLVRPCSHKPEKARTRERRRSWLFCS